MLRRLVTCAPVMLAVTLAAAPATAYKESLDSRFDFLSELNYVGEDKPLLLRNCGGNGPNGLRFLKIRQYFDKRTDTMLWVITTERRKDVLYYVSAYQLSCVIEQQ